MHPFNQYCHKNIEPQYILQHPKLITAQAQAEQQSLLKKKQSLPSRSSREPQLHNLIDN